MKKVLSIIFFLGIFSNSFAGISSIEIEKNCTSRNPSGLSTSKLESSSAATTNTVCHICCTISVPDGFGGLIGVMACAGWLFTSCETAGERACEKAMTNALDILLASN